jgi:hypothetical protein
MNGKKNQDAKAGKGGIVKEHRTIDKTTVNIQYIIQPVKSDRGRGEPSEIDGREDLQPIKDREYC